MIKKTIKNKKKTILAVSLIGLFTLVGGTIAYHTSTGSFANLFGVGRWQAQFIETFDSPDPWGPCDEIPKTVIARNNGDVPAVVRLKYEEYWKEVGSTSSSDDHTTELPLIDSDNNVVAIINLDNVNDWELKSDGWYYYKKLLMPGQDTSSFMRSVTYNCNINNGGANNTCTTVGNATSCTRPNNPYEGATYHIYITIQMSEKDGDPDWPIDLDRIKVYDYVASLTSGLDTNIEFRDENTDTGVYTLSAHANDAYPVYYYRGDITNNYAIFGDYCWLLMRTTGTGGTKMMYAGPVTNGTCIENRNSYERSAIKYDESSTIGNWGVPYNITDTELNRSSYMLGYPLKKRTVNNSKRLDSCAEYRGWSNGSYNLNYCYYGITSAAEALDYRYFYPDSSNHSKIAYVLYRTSSVIYYTEIENGVSPTDLRDLYFDNITDSNAKATVDGWFEDNLIKYVNKLEDTVFCNDRNVAGRDLEQEFWTASDNGTAPSTSYTYDVNTRVFFNYGLPHPSVDCTRKKDSFTVNESATGNGKLTYPIGLPTGDEIRMANPAQMAKSSFEFSGAWTMSPSAPNGLIYWFSSLSTYGVTSDFRADLRPMVSLKNETYIGGGMGTYSNPFTLEW